VNLPSYITLQSDILGPFQRGKVHGYGVTSVQEECSRTARREGKERLFKCLVVRLLKRLEDGTLKWFQIE
jgi:hypothetical protein